MNAVTHIVPLFAPVIDGVGDYALNLARRLREQHGFDSRFVVCDPLWRGADRVEDFPVVGPTGFDALALSHALGDTPNILLHYVGYGFHRRGIPVWLTRALQNVRQSRLVTIFHEIWSSGPPWRSVFYLAPLQRRLVSKILTLSADAFTSTAWTGSLLNQMRPGAVTVLPVSANIDTTAAHRSRARIEPPWRPLFFGQTWTRVPSVTAHRGLLQSLNSRGELDRVLVLGKQSAKNPPSEDVTLLSSLLSPERIDVIGERSAADAAEIFASADFLLASHPARDICKSGAILSAFGCGCPAVVTDDAESAPLRPGEHFLHCNNSPDAINAFVQRINSGVLPQIGAAANRWFRQNADWPVIAGKIAAQLHSQPVAHATA